MFAVPQAKNMVLHPIQGKTTLKMALYCAAGEKIGVFRLPKGKITLRMAAAGEKK